MLINKKQLVNFITYKWKNNCESIILIISFSRHLNKRKINSGSKEITKYIQLLHNKYDYY